MYLLLFPAIEAPLQIDPNLLVAGASLTTAGLLAGAWLSRKQWKKLRRKLVWAAIREKWRGFRKPGGDDTRGCIVLVAIILLLAVLAVFLWKVALIILLVLLIIWLIRNLSGGHTNHKPPYF